MSSVQHLREFISARLTAAAEEIFAEFEKTIVQYEEEIDRQRRLLDVTWKPHTHLNPAELPAHYICVEDEDDAADEQSSNQKEESSLVQIRKSSLDQDKSSLDQKEPEPPQVKEEPEEMCIGQREELFVPKQEADIVMVTPPGEEPGDSGTEPDGDLLLLLSSGGENQNQKRSECESPDVIEISEVKEKRRADGEGSPAGDVHGSPDVQCVSNPSETFPKCEIFGDVFRFNPNLNEQFLSHASEKPLICNVCGKRFSSLSTLKVHSKIHTGVGLLYCKICGRGFTRRDILRLHMRIHTGEKPYFCKTCGKSFRHSGTLTDHERTHTGEKPYTCHFCWKSFTYKRGLTVHMRTHTFISL